MTPTLLALCTPLILPVQDTEPAPLQLGVEIAATAGEVQVTFAELDEALIWRHGRSANGVEALSSLLDLTVLELLATESGLTVSDKQIAARWGEIEREVKTAGVAEDLYEYLAQNEISPETFRAHLRLAIVHEALARESLGIGPDTPLSGEQQTTWLEGIHAARGLTQEEHPWTEGIVAHSGDLPITRAAYSKHLRSLIPREELTELGYSLSLEKVLLSRMPDLAQSAIDNEVEAELSRRAQRVESDPRYKGVSYERLLEAQGLSLAGLRRDPGVRVHALSQLWFSRSHDEASLRKIYEEERELFDARHGEAVDVYTLLLRGARFKNELNPRTFEEADAALVKIRDELEGLDDFRRVAKELSEERTTRDKDGYLGRVTEGMLAVPLQIRRAAFEAVEAVRTEEGVGSVSGKILGPIRIQGGSVLLCLGDRHPAPTWEKMAQYVAGELRRRMRGEALPREAVLLWFESR